MSREMKHSDFRAKCLAVIDEVEKSGEKVVITKNGKPFVELVPYRRSNKKNPIRGILKDQLRITGDIMSPIDVEWDAMKDSDETP